MINASPSPFIYPGKHARDFLVMDLRSLQQVRDRSRAVNVSCMRWKAGRQPSHVQVSRSKAASSKAPLRDVC